MRTFKKFLFSSLLSLLGMCFPASLYAQYNGSTSLATVSNVLASGATCTGSAQNFITGTTPGFSNLGQTSHLATATSPAVQFQMEIDGIDALGGVYRLSDLQIGVPTSARGGLVVTAAGYMTRIQVSVTCSAGATFSASYAGSFSPQPPSIAGALLVSVDKTPFQTAPANATSSITFQTPSANSGGTVVFQYAAAGPANSSIVLQCLTNGNTPLALYTFPLATVTTPQLFAISASTCPFVTLTYTSGGASATTYNLEYVFTTTGMTGTAVDPCATTVPKSVAVVNTFVNSLIVTQVAGASVYVCGFSLTISGTTSPQFTFAQATGVSCATSFSNISGNWLAPNGGSVLVVSPPTIGSIMKTSVGLGLCVAPTGTSPSVGGIVNYVIQ